MVFGNAIMGITLYHPRGIPRRISPDDVELKK